MGSGQRITRWVGPGGQGLSVPSEPDYLRRRGIKATIPSKADQDANRHKKGSKVGRPPAFDPAVRYEATVHIAAINEWL